MNKVVVLVICGHGMTDVVAAAQVGQLLTNLRVSSSNMLLPFTAQIMQLLQDSPHNPTGACISSAAVSRKPLVTISWHMLSLQLHQQSLYCFGSKLP